MPEKTKLNSPGTLAGPRSVPWGDYLRARPLGRGRPADLAAGAGVAGERHETAKCQKFIGIWVGDLKGPGLDFYSKC